jgi:Uma2 family endonuclease
MNIAYTLTDTGIGGEARRPTMVVSTIPREMVLRSTDTGWTRSDWETLPDDGKRYEIIDGVLYVSTAPSLFHQWIGGEIVAELREQLVRPRIAFIFAAPVGLFMPGCDPVQPDIVAVLQADREILRERRIFGVPALIVEILSPSNPEQDLQVKLAAYARAGLPEYWVFRPAERDALVHSHPELGSGRYLQVTHVPPDGTLESPTLPFSATLAAFFAGAPDTTL